MIRGRVALALLLVVWVPSDGDAQAAPAGARRFQHGQHAPFPCGECHGTGGATTASNREWCADCHHVQVSLTECDRCHVPSDLAPPPLQSAVTFELSVAEPRTRQIRFDHDLHLDLGCAECHTGGAELRVRQSCTDCHVEHHEPARECMACHAEPPTTAHPRELHRELSGCGTAGCHVSEGLDFAALADRRNLCLVCHQAQRDHERAGSCGACHILGGEGDPSRMRAP